MIDAWEIQQAIYTALQADTDLAALVSGVFDYVPEDQVRPYVTIGEDTLTDSSLKDCDAATVEIIINTWTDGPGRKEAKQIGAAVQTAIEAGITMANQYAVALTLIDHTTLKDNDGEIIRGIIRFNCFVHDNPA